MRGWRRPNKSFATLSSEALAYGGYEVQPDVRMIPEGELFAGTWIIVHCFFGRSIRGGYEIRCLEGDNDHFASRSEAMRAAMRRAIQTIELGEVDAQHLSTIPSPDLQARHR